MCCISGALCFAGYDWGGRAACVGAALWPERCIGLVSVNGYLIQELRMRWCRCGRSARCRCGISIIFRSSAVVPALPPTGAASSASMTGALGIGSTASIRSIRRDCSSAFARLADGAQRPAKAMLFPGKLKQAFAQERID